MFVSIGLLFSLVYPRKSELLDKAVGTEIAWGGGEDNLLHQILTDQFPLFQLHGQFMPTKLLPAWALWIFRPSYGPVGRSKNGAIQ